MAAISSGPILNNQEFAEIQKLVYQAVGINLTEQKRSLVVSRLSKRLRTLKMNSYAEYLHFIRKNPEEIVIMFNALSTNVTSFFREEHHFIYLTETFIPELEAAANGRNNEFRAWSAGCSTGEEPYTLAMFLDRCFRGIRGWQASILATDINTEALRKAKDGVYSKKEVKGIPYDYLKEYFRLGQGANSGLFRVKENLQQMITFRRFNLLKAEPLQKSLNLDIIFCRNVFIYFDQETRLKVLSMFHRNLKPGGLLFIGHSESIGRDDHNEQNWRFLKHTIYHRIP